MISKLNTSRRMLLVIVASLVLHLLTLYIFTKNNTSNVLGTFHQQPSINIQLVQIKKPIDKKKNKVIKQKAKEKQTEAKKNKSSELVKKTTEAHFKDTQKKPEVETDQFQRTKIITKVKNRIRTYFYYPRIAQNKNWQGSVKLNFNISSAGQIHLIQIAQSSGYSILDDAAIEALNKVKQDIQIKSFSLSNQLPFELTVEYKLKES